ncbi:MAG: DUF2938 domain-containing protein [Hydrogenophaga sp.]|uniref:DUF2938 domain-containing protein n=1 Tax=Hydrogenophaga crocea TaxID=2716225 RepID=A0A6G8IDV0_9BURK|nr:MULTISPECIES: DUF2938 domain-containing protein [Hydrogenophaga]MBL0942967.1 DUF2938 domain-containing protein [Hydrogenophaga sp.]QIM51248.1 DUF2938 domain-containing protein [Hydrogenophaga crocea]
MPLLSDPGRIVLIGLGATAAMDAWLLLLTRFGQPFAGFGLIGRWVGHMRHGRFAHPAIARAAPVPGEQALGWLTHYTVGVAYAVLLVLWQGDGWLQRPSWPPALAFGLLTVAAPFLLMQPAMGAGIAASKTPQPGANRLRSLANHTVFGAGLFFSAALLERICP